MGKFLPLSCCCWLVQALILSYQAITITLIIELSSTDSTWIHPSATLIKQRLSILAYSYLSWLLPNPYFLSPQLPPTEYSLYSWPGHTRLPQTPFNLSLQPCFLLHPFHAWTMTKLQESPFTLPNSSASLLMQFPVPGMPSCPSLPILMSEPPLLLQSQPKHQPVLRLSPNSCLTHPQTSLSRLSIQTPESTYPVIT